MQIRLTVALLKYGSLAGQPISGLELVDAAAPDAVTLAGAEGRLDRMCSTAVGVGLAALGSQT